MNKRYVLLIIIVVVSLLCIACSSDKEDSSTPEPSSPTFIENKYTLTMDVEGEGEVVPFVGKHQYDKGSIITIEAIASEGWIFDKWNGPVTNPLESKTTLSIDSNIEVTAVFALFSSEDSVDECAYTEFSQGGEGFTAVARAWNCNGLEGEWSLEYTITIDAGVAQGVIEGDTVFVFPPKGDEDIWLSLPYSYSISGTLTFPEGRAEISYTYDNLIMQIFDDSGNYYMEYFSGSGTALVEVFVDGIRFVVSQTYFDFSDTSPELILFGNCHQCSN